MSNSASLGPRDHDRLTGWLAALPDERVFDFITDQAVVKGRTRIFLKAARKKIAKRRSSDDRQFEAIVNDIPALMGLQIAVSQLIDSESKALLQNATSRLLAAHARVDFEPVMPTPGLLERLIKCVETWSCRSTRHLVAAFLPKSCGRADRWLGLTILSERPMAEVHEAIESQNRIENTSSVPNDGLEWDRRFEDEAMRPKWV